MDAVANQFLGKNPQERQNRKENDPMTLEKTRLALEISTQYTSVFRCEGDVPKECLGSVATDDPEYDLKLGQVMAHLKNLGLAGAQKDVWLADDQIISRHLRLDATGRADRREQAGRALSAITPYQPEDLSFALGAEGADGYTAVAAVPIKKLDEILALARVAEFQDSVVTSTDDIEGFEERPVWRAVELATSSWMRVMQAACFLLAVTVPLLLAGAANNADFGGQLRSFLAFTPSFSGDRVEAKVAAVNPNAAAISDLTRPSDAVPPQLAARNRADQNLLEAYVQRHIGELMVPAPAVYDPVLTPLALPKFNGLIAPDKPGGWVVPRPPNVDASVPVPEEPGGFIGIIEGIKFLLATQDPAPLRPRGFGVQVANLDVQFLTQMPKKRTARRAAIVPKIMAMPKMRPFPPLPEEIFGQAQLPKMKTPISSVDMRLTRPKVELPIAEMAMPQGTTMDRIEADIQASLAVAQAQRREAAIIAAANMARAPGARIKGPRKRDLVPLGDIGGAVAQVSVDQLSRIRAVSSAAEFDVPSQTAAMRFSPGHPAIDALVPSDVKLSMDAMFDERAAKARLASLMVFDDAGLSNAPRLRRRAESAPPQVAAIAPATVARPAPVIAPSVPVQATPALETPPEIADPETAAPEIAETAVVALDFPAPKQRDLSKVPLGGVPASAGVMASYLPLNRPKDLAQKAAAIVEKRNSAAARVAARQTPRATTPSKQLRIPSSARVASVATIRDGLDLGNLSLIGIFGKSNQRHALMRTAQGRIEKVTNGQRIGGWTVASIGDDGVRIQKRSKTKVLRLPN